MKICSNCCTVFADSAVTTNENCPVRFCCGSVIEIDENLFEVCLLLNANEYFTTSCCAGHSTDACPRTYIQFMGEVDFPYLPSGFELETVFSDEGEVLTNMSKLYDRHLPSTELQKQIWETVRELLDWAENLAGCEDEADECELLPIGDLQIHLRHVAGHLLAFAEELESRKDSEDYLPELSPKDASA